MTIRVDENRGKCVLNFTLVLNNSKINFRVEAQIDKEKSRWEFPVVQYANNKSVVGDLKYYVKIEANRLIHTQLYEQLKPKKPVKYNLTDRLRISYYATVTIELKNKGRFVIKSSDLMILAAVTREIKYKFVKTAMEALRTGHSVPNGCFISLLDDTIVKVRAKYPFGNEQLEFYRSVIARAFAWRGGVPYKQLQLARQLMPEGKVDFG